MTGGEQVDHCLKQCYRFPQHVSRLPPNYSKYLNEQTPNKITALRMKRSGLGLRPNLCLAHQ